MRVLVAEDDDTTLKFLVRNLSESGHDVVTATCGKVALTQVTTEAFEAIILDRLLPKVDGLAVLESMRARACLTPTILLTALGQIEDRVEGLKAGADDYLTKPFAFAELSARLEAITRRRRFDDTMLVLNVGELSLNLIERDLRYCGRRILLQPREYRLLEQLMRNPGRVVTRTMILENVWGFHFDPQTNLVETHMSRLRSKMKLAGVRDCIQTVRGIGYRLRVDS